jgi:hypothetical protein
MARRGAVTENHISKEWTAKNVLQRKSSNLCARWRPSAESSAAARCPR